MEEKQKNETPQIDVSVDEKIVSGVYCNFPIVTFSETEFVFDFASTLPGMPKIQVQSRVVLTPEVADRFLKDLSHKMEYFKKQVNNNSEKDFPIIYGEQAKA